jgi:hypothetical protein
MLSVLSSGPPWVVYMFKIRKLLILMIYQVITFAKSEPELKSIKTVSYRNKRYESGSNRAIDLKL